MEKSIANYLPIKECTGCGACKNICPKDAIDLVRDEEGFLKYYLDEKECIDCGKCSKICPVFTPKYKNAENPKCYAMWATDDIRLRSSSGGMFLTLANYFLKKNGYVAGVVYDERFHPVHIISNNYDDVLRMSGSKYMQSDTKFVFREIKKLLSSNKDEYILFTGMPCQVAALNNFLGREYKNLYFVDIVCHGITSTKVFEKYAKSIFGDKKLTNIEFKKKSPWGWHAGINAEFSDGSVYQEPAEKDLFFQAYLRNISKSSACEKCRFNHIPRQGDITMGDFWGISKYNSDWNDNKGTSLILTNTKKGEELYQKITDNIQKTEEVPLNYAISGNHSLIEPYKNNFRRTKFFREIDNISFEKLTNHCKNNTFDIGIVGLWFGLNYGSILTYYALYCVVEQLGYDAIMVNKPDFIWRPLYDDPNTIANRFINKYCSVSGLHKKSEYPILNKHCRTFLVGSDVVWNYEICGREADDFFYLDFADDSKKKIAYAASFGGGYHAPKEIQNRNKLFARKFDAISVREDAAVNICKKKFGIVATKVIDPVFLCDIKNYEKAIKDSTVTTNFKYIMTYILGGNELQKNIILNISKKLNIKKLINVVNPNNPKRVIEAMKLDTVPEPSVEDWLNYMKHCQFFVGDSFHGLCFAIIFKRPFIIAITKGMPSKDRFETLLSICGLEERLWFIEDDNSDKYAMLEKEIDYDSVYARLENYKQSSLIWIKRALSGDKKAQNKYEIEVPENENLELFYLARAVYRNYGGRQVVTWGDNEQFRRILKKYFGIDIPYWVAKNRDLVNNHTIRSFDELKGKSNEIYVVIPNNKYNPNDEKLFKQYGYEDEEDYLYRYHKTIVIDKGDFRNKSYIDTYGNCINGNVNGICSIRFRGFNNTINLGNNIRTTEPIQVEMSGCGLLEIGNDCMYSGENKIVFMGQHYSISKIRIKDSCVFNSSKITAWNNPVNNISSEILINNGVTFGTNCNLTVNTGHKIVLGEDCMFSSDVLLQAGDGHAIFDTKNVKERINKNSQTLFLNNHVWVGRQAIILGKTSIGEGSIIGAGAVVKGEYPNNCVVVGNPSYIVKQNTGWSRDNGANDIIQCGQYTDITRNCKNPIAGKKVLVLGGTNFMGISLVNELLKLGNAVTIATRGIHDAKFISEVKRLIIDRDDAKSVHNALKGKYYDVVFDNTAYCSNYVKNVMDVVKCNRYIQLSSDAVYGGGTNIKETKFNPFSTELRWCGSEIGYGTGKRQAECAIYQEYKDISSVTVRLPYVAKTDRILFYVRNIINGIPMKIHEFNEAFNFVQSNEVGKFLPWIAAQNYNGPINFASKGILTVGILINYIETKTGKKAVISEKGVQHPFSPKAHSLNLSNVENLGYRLSCVDDWFWNLVDSYIEQVKKENK